MALGAERHERSNHYSAYREGNMMLRTELVVLAALALTLPTATQAQPVGWTGSAGATRVGSYEMPLQTSCPNGITCTHTETINIQGGWTDARVFLKEVEINPTTSKVGDQVGNLHVEIVMNNYDPATGDLTITEQATITNGSGAPFEFQVYISYVAWKDFVPGVPAMAVTDLAATCAGTSDTTCNATLTTPRTGGAGPYSYAFLGFALTSFDINLPDKFGNPTPSNIGRIELLSVPGNVTSSSADWRYGCSFETTSAPNGLPMNCKFKAVALGALGNIVGPIGTHDEGFNVTNTFTSSYSRSHSDTISTPPSGAFSFFERMHAERDGVSGWVFAPVQSLRVGCGDLTYPIAPPYTVSVRYMVRWQDQTASPWVWYHGWVGCQTIWQF